jgi:hypothetical protein
VPISAQLAGALQEAKRKGSFFDQGRTPKEGEKVWALVGQVDQKPIKGTILRVERTYHGGHYYCDVQTAKGVKRVSSDLLFDHRPKRVKRTDQFGEVTVWESLEESWKPVAGHYAQGVRYQGEFKGHKAVLEKRKKHFFLLYKGKEHNLGKRATFDHAERIIARQ